MFTIDPDIPETAVSISYYPTFEAREAAFNASVGRLVPSRLSGPAQFWDDLSDIVQRRLEASPDGHGAFITSNPRDCLAFATPHQVLVAACLRGGAAAGGIEAAAADTATAFRLTANAHQPLRTLSGGETVKLALAKSAIAAAYSPWLCVSSPFSWLSSANAGLLSRLVAGYFRRRRPVSMFALAEEDRPEPDPATASALDGVPEVDCRLRLAGVSVRLSSAVALATADPPRVDIADAAFTLPSPCLLMGDNGQGKSLLAKLIAGAMAGRGRIDAGGASGAGGRPRMVFQDVMAQTLSRTAADLMDGVDGYRELADTWRDAARGPDDAMPSGASLIRTKLMLTAQRLTGGTSLLILDEPDWGLSRRHAAAYVRAVVRVAHRRGIPVMIISHKPWWTPMARSRLTVTKTFRGDGTGDNLRGFSIRLTREAGAL